MNRRRGTGVLLAIAVFKLVKAAVLVAVGVGALSLIHDNEIVRSFERLVNALRIDANNRFINRGIAAVSGLDSRHLEEVGIGTFAYAALFLVEGTGLLLRKRWAEYLTTIITASFIPLEIYEIVRHASVLKALTIAVNMAIVVYLYLRLRAERREKRAPAKGRSES